MTAAVLAAVLSCAAGARAADVMAGLDVLAERNFEDLRGKRIGLITNQTGKSRRKKSTVELLAKAPGVTLAALFSPEHGFAGTSEEAKIGSGSYKLPGGRAIPLYSLYGATLAPTREMLSGLDALVFDIQDAGTRFYTYATTMGMAMEAAGRSDVDFFVLDRPNPITGDIVEGPILSAGIRHFTAYFPVPARPGLTLGELARLHVILNKVDVRLRVVPLKGWSRSMWYDETGLPWTQPSPNLPDLESAAMYPGIACLEYTNLSVGRGTPKPFLWVGAPWLDAPALLERLRKAGLPGVEFALADYKPRKSAHKGKKCRGVRMQVTDRRALRPLAVFAHIVAAVRDLHPMEFDPGWESTRRMVGTDRFRELYDAGAGPERFISLFNEGAREFQKARSVFLLY